MVLIALIKDFLYKNQEFLKENYGVLWNFYGIPLYFSKEPPVKNTTELPKITKDPRKFPLETPDFLKEILDGCDEDHFWHDASYAKMAYFYATWCDE